uniref:Uncharacterized protein n=1 Tax=Timema genevievae TaxID=629358 RepID=A0A7R9JUL8_TIMGE|nr:unnamed protein product [Timema genevievae]
MAAAVAGLVTCNMDRLRRRVLLALYAVEPVGIYLNNLINFAYRLLKNAENHTWMRLLVLRLPAISGIHLSDTTVGMTGPINLEEPVLFLLPG